MNNVIVDNSGALDAIARRIIDANRYLTLATADSAGQPWASPVWYVHEDYTRFLWVSRPGARHSRNIADRPVVSAVIVDSTAAVGQGKAVYLEAVAEELDGVERGRAIPNSRAAPRPWDSTNGPAPR